MLKLNLAELEHGEVRLCEQISPDDPMFDGGDLTLVQPLRVDLRAQYVEDAVLVRGTAETVVELECRRCLATVRQELSAPVDLLFEAMPSEDAAELLGEVYPLPPHGAELDLAGPVREQVVLNAPAYEVCEEECLGLCPNCGANRNESPCECVPERAPSAWDALKQVKFD